MQVLHEIAGRNSKEVTAARQHHAICRHSTKLAIPLHSRAVTKRERDDSVHRMGLDIDEVRLCFLEIRLPVHAPIRSCVTFLILMSPWHELLLNCELRCTT